VTTPTCSKGQNKLGPAQTGAVGASRRRFGIVRAWEASQLCGGGRGRKLGLELDNDEITTWGDSIYRALLPNCAQQGN
jgi:hypothetical protein